jgi:hypothetical protein
MASRDIIAEVQPRESEKPPSGVEGGEAWRYMGTIGYYVCTSSPQRAPRKHLLAKLDEKPILPIGTT